MDKFIKVLKDKITIPDHRKTVVCVLLCLILLYGFSVRFLGIRTGDYWDEPQSVSTALQILKTGDFNPHYFHYPAFTIYSCFFIDIFHYYYLMGRENSDFDYLRSLKDIQTEYDTGYHWELSHPSFLHWNRAFICILGTICILLTYFVTRDLYGKVAGIIAALLIAGFPYYIAHSRYVLPNLPLGFFVLLVLVFALKFNRSGKLRDLIISAIFVGCAIASKYPAFIAILVPCVAYILNFDQLKKSDRILAPILIILLPIIVFSLINPFVIFDFATFSGV